MSYNVICTNRDGSTSTITVNQEWLGADHFWGVSGPIHQSYGLLTKTYEAEKVVVDVHGATMQVKPLVEDEQPPEVDPLDVLENIVRIGQPGGTYYEARQKAFRNWKRQYLHTVTAVQSIDMLSLGMVNYPQDLIAANRDVALKSLGKEAVKVANVIETKTSDKYGIYSITATMTVIGVRPPEGK